MPKKLSPEANRKFMKQAIAWLRENEPDLANVDAAAANELVNVCMDGLKEAGIAVNSSSPRDDIGKKGSFERRKKPPMDWTDAKLVKRESMRYLQKKMKSQGEAAVCGKTEKKSHSKAHLTSNEEESRCSSAAKSKISQANLGAGHRETSSPTSKGSPFGADKGGESKQHKVKKLELDKKSHSKYRVASTEPPEEEKQESMGAKAVQTEVHKWKKVVERKKERTEQKRLGTGKGQEAVKEPAASMQLPSLPKDRTEERARQTLATTEMVDAESSNKLKGEKDPENNSLEQVAAVLVDQVDGSDLVDQTVSAQEDKAKLVNAEGGKSYQQEKEDTPETNGIGDVTASMHCFSPLHDRVLETDDETPDDSEFSEQATGQPSGEGSTNSTQRANGDRHGDGDTSLTRPTTGLQKREKSKRKPKKKTGKANKKEIEQLAATSSDEGMETDKRSAQIKNKAANARCVKQREGVIEVSDMPPRSMETAETTCGCWPFSRRW
eukprot:Sro1056_g236170.2  (495) ;mRNA; r:13642-15126